MEAEAEPQLEVEAIQKTRSHEQCEANSHVTDNTDLEYDPIDYSRYNKVAGLCLVGHHEHSENHRKGEMEQASPKCLWKPQSTETESQLMNGVVTENVIKGWDGRANEDLFLDVVKLYAKFNKSKDHKDLIHVGQHQ